MKNIDLNFFPGWTRKSITFTMDDGWVAMDTVFVDIVRPYGIKGAFNISSQNITKYNNPELIRSLYRGFEITNHVRLHPFAFRDGDEAVLSDEFFNESNADKSVCYREAGSPEGVYLRYSERNDRWDRVCTARGYITLVEECHKELEDIFGKGSVRGFVWPYYRQSNSELTEYLKTKYYGLRDAGKNEPMEDAAFSLPSDRSDWHYNARHSNLLARAAEYEALADDGNLKWFAFGVHAHDFDHSGNWDDLREFCRKYGNRHEDFWYATNAEIFDYEDAVKSVIITDTAIKNPSDVTLYIKVDGTRFTLCPGCEIRIGTEVNG